MEHEKKFTTETGNLIRAFLNQLQAPVCLVAHNGFMFDFPILRKQLYEVVNVYLMTFPTRSILIYSFLWSPIQGVPMHDIFCVDSLEIFRNIANNPSERLEDIACSSKESTNEPTCSSSSNDLLTDETTHSSGIEALLNTDVQKRQQQNEKTPSSRKVKADQTKMRLQEIEKLSGVRVGSKSKRALFPCNEKGDAPTASKKRVSYKLVDIYARLHGAEPAVAHNAEEDAINLMKCCIAVNKQFVERSERSAKEFMAIKPLGRK